MYSKQKLPIINSQEFAIHLVMEQRRSGCPWIGVHRDGDQLAGDGHGAASHGHIEDYGQGKRRHRGLGTDADQDGNLGNNWWFIFSLQCLFRRRRGERRWWSKFYRERRWLLLNIGDGRFFLL